ncbi:hypothetical protein L1987_32237 [Smallanthus sonchifolius]|uniref:Uncharacterized protein n=1 Tax=Smallanthus sonchifolius TaxID=185202 RepID=A0ACB9I736_9ASTR|nr:hypothetical protein L1987_32237 [Smallanthus sonchifolius]
MKIKGAYVLSTQAQSLEHGFKDLLDEYGLGEIPINEMVDKLMSNTVKDDINMLPPIYSLEFEYQLSSVFVNTVSTKRRYGTRSTSGLTVKVNGEVFFYEKHLENDLWKDQTETYMIEKNDE